MATLLTLKNDSLPLLLTEKSPTLNTTHPSPTLPLHPRALEQIKRVARASFEHIQTALLNVTALPNQYLTPRQLSLLGIKLSHLNLRTGDVSDSDQVFMRPRNGAWLDAVVGRCKTWEMHKMPYAKNPVNFQAAMEVGDLLSAYLTLCQNPNDESLLRGTGWIKRQRMLPFERELYSRGDGADWEAAFIMECKDIERPHIVVFLADGVPMRETMIGRTEIECLLAVMADRLKTPQHYERHRIVPVTLISTSSRKLRILQAHYTPTPTSKSSITQHPLSPFSPAKSAINLTTTPKSTFHANHGFITLRKSSIIDFEREHVATTKRVLGWLVADVCGETEHERLVFGPGGRSGSLGSRFRRWVGVGRG